MGLNLLLSALIVYCFACYAFVFYWASRPCAQGDEQPWEYFQELRQRRPLRGWLALAATFVFLSPLIVPYAVVICTRERRQESQRYRQLLRVHKPFAFLWLNPDKLPAAPSGYIEEHTDEMRDEEFEAVGTYLMKTMLPDYYGRVFIHSSGTSIASLCYLNGDTFFSFSTVLESGRVLETTPASPSAGLLCFVDNPRMTAHFASGETIAGACHRHWEKVIDIFEETGDRPLAFSPDQACDVLEYEGCVFSGELFALGRLDETPPEPILPAGRPVEPEPLPLSSM